MNKKFVRISALIIAVLMLFSLCSCSFADDTEETIEYAQKAPETKEEILDRFNSVVAAVKSGNPAISYSLDQGAKGCECENKYVDAAFKTVADMITDENFSQSTKYGESTKDIFPVMGSDDAAVLEINDIRTAFVTDNEAENTYTIIITIYPEGNPEEGSGVFGKIYKIEKNDDILANFKSISNLLTADSYDAQYGTGTIKATINKTSGHMTRLELRRDVAVSTEVTGQGTLASVGTVPMTFNYNSTEKFDIEWDNPDTDELES